MSPRELTLLCVGSPGFRTTRADRSSTGNSSSIFSSTSRPSGPSIGATITGFTDVSTRQASGSQKCSVLTLHAQLFRCWIHLQCSPRMMKPLESVNTATCPFSTRLSTGSSGRRTSAASNAISNVDTLSRGIPDDLLADVLNAVASSTTERKLGRAAADLTPWRVVDWTS